MNGQLEIWQLIQSSFPPLEGIKIAAKILELY